MRLGESEVLSGLDAVSELKSGAPKHYRQRPPAQPDLLQALTFSSPGI